MSIVCIGVCWRVGAGGVPGYIPIPQCFTTSIILLNLRPNCRLSSSIVGNRCHVLGRKKTIWNNKDDTSGSASSLILFVNMGLTMLYKCNSKSVEYSLGDGGIDFSLGKY